MTRRSTALCALVLLSAYWSPARAFSVASSAGDPCHERMTMAAWEGVFESLPESATHVVAPEGGIWRALAKRLLPGVGLDPSVLSDEDSFALVSLVLGARAPDTDGHSVADIDAMRMLHADTSEEGQYAHALRALHDDGPEGNARALAGTRALLRELLDEAISWLEHPPVERNTQTTVYMDFYGEVDVHVDGFAFTVGKAAHLVQDSFSHTVRSEESDWHEILHVLNYIDAINDDIDEEQDGLAHSARMDECNHPDVAPIADAAVVATGELFLALVAELREGDGEAVEEFMDDWLTLRPGCDLSNELCGHPEELTLARKKPTEPILASAFGCSAGEAPAHSLTAGFFAVFLPFAFLFFRFHRVGIALPERAKAELP